MERHISEQTLLLHRIYRDKIDCRVSHQFLPPASEGWRKVLFSVCLSVHTSPRGGGGYLSKVWMVGEGGYPSQVLMGGVPQPGLDGGEGTQVTPQPYLDGGGYPGLDGGGVPPPARSGWWGFPGYLPGQVWMVGGTPWPGLDGVPPTMTEWGTPPRLDGVPPPS